MRTNKYTMLCTEAELETGKLKFWVGNKLWYGLLSVGILYLFKSSLLSKETDEKAVSSCSFWVELQRRSSSSSMCCFTSAETVRTIKYYGRGPWTYSATFTHLLSSERKVCRTMELCTFMPRARQTKAGSGSITLGSSLKCHLSVIASNHNGQLRTRKLVYCAVGTVRPQELCELKGNRLGLPVPNSSYDLCGRKATLNSNSVGTAWYADTK